MRNGTSIRSLCAYIGLFSGLFTACGDETVSVDEGDTTCQNACRSGAHRCFDEKQVEICIVKSNGCSAWSEPQLCPGDSVCSEDACQSCPEKTCDAGDRKCDDDGARVCADFDANGCLEWSEPSPCPNGCDGDVCKECQNACNPGQKSCDQNGARLCADFDDDGCLEWSEPSPCQFGCDGDVCHAATAYEPTRYPGDAILSPITPYVADQMRAIRAKNGARNDNSFMKLGDSHMYKDSSFMYCFSTNHPKHDGYDLAGLPVTDAVSAFQSSFDAFARVSVAAVLGKTASFPIANNAQLLKEEIAATNPRFAFYGYGTNDMGWFDYRKYASNGQGGYFAAMQLYFRNVLAAVDSLVDAGIIPVVIGTGWRNDKAKYYGTSTYVADKDLPKHFVTTYNAVSRGIAEYYQIPYYNLQLSHSSIGDFGLSSDGIHHKTIHNGCDFTSQGLAAGANRRNRYAIELLQNAYNAAVHDKTDPAAKTLPFKGDGSHANPYLIDSLPYTHMHTTTSGEKKFDVYNCSASAKEYGPEKIYRLTVSKQTRIRAFAMSASGVDVDVHLLSSLNSNACRVRGDRWLEANLSPGAYYFAVDTFNSTASNANAGLYLFGVHACDPDDADCGSRDAGQ